MCECVLHINRSHFYVYLLLFLCVWLFFLHTCPYIMCVPDAGWGRKKVSDPLRLGTDGCESPRGCWGPNPGLLKSTSGCNLRTTSPAPGYFLKPRKKSKDTSRKLKPREGVGHRRIFKKTNRYLDAYKTLKMTSAHEWKVPEMVNKHGI